MGWKGLCVQKVLPKLLLIFVWFLGNGLLGNWDGNWLNEFYQGNTNPTTYINEYLTADTKFTEAEK